jgi:serine/threonine-protein kinase
VPAGTPSNLADWGTRAIGAVIDWLPAFIISVVTYRAYFLSLLSLAYWAYLGHLEGVSGQTPGKAMQGTRLVDENGQVLGSGQGIGRKFLHILDILVCWLGFLLPLVDNKRQTIADKVVNSYVVTGVEKKPFNVNLWMVPKP